MTSLFSARSGAMIPHEAASNSISTPPTLEDLWSGDAHFVLQTTDTGLPMGESDSTLLTDGMVRSYVHASFISSGIVDSCGTPVAFPGCVVVYSSQDDGNSFSLWIDRLDERREVRPSCLIPCRQCPCQSSLDHVDQQQYPRVVKIPGSPETAPRESWIMAYEYRAGVYLRRSANGLAWSSPEPLPFTRNWQRWLMDCRPESRIGPHPFAEAEYDCLVGGPPGIYVDTSGAVPELYVFLALGQNPGSLGCYRGPAFGSASLMRLCDHSPLFSGAVDYGPLDLAGPAANPYFDFRTVSSAEIMQVGDRYYMLFEGVRGPAAGDAGDTQFALGLARSKTEAIDGPWEIWLHNPILEDLPGNVGLGHADLIEIDSVLYLYTSLDGVQRSRLILEWR